MEQLTKNFNRLEFACRGGHRCCGGSAPVSDWLIENLQELRDRIDKPITVVSGFRCLIYNYKIWSQPTSQHTKGRAVDIRVADMTPLELRSFALEVDAFEQGGIGLYENFLHLDVRQTRARW